MGIIETVKDTVKIVQQIGNMPLIQKILDLQTEVLKLVEQHKEKDAIIAKLRKALELKGEMILEHSAYWHKDEQGNIIDGPFCTNCFDSENVTRRLIGGNKPKDQVGRPWEWIQCPKCSKSFRNKHVGEYLNNH